IDLDGDGDKDVIGAGGFANKIGWWENDGGGNFGVRNELPGNISNPYAVFAIDLDSDGDADIMSSSTGSGNVFWWENDGSGNFGAQQLISAALDGSYDIFAIDLDDDNNVDVLGAGMNNSEVVWWKNDGNENFGVKIPLPDGLDQVFTIYAIDLDGDGNKDVVSAGYNNTSEGIAWWKNDGNENFTRYIIDATFDWGVSVHAFDVDSDDDVDLIASSYDTNRIVWWENEGADEDWTAHDLPLSRSGPVGVYAADMDNDGDTDIVGTAGDDEKMLWFENDGNEIFTEHIIADNFGFMWFIYVSDIDNDGDLDVLGPSETLGDVTWWEQDGVPTATFTWTGLKDNVSWELPGNWLSSTGNGYPNFSNHKAIINSSADAILTPGNLTIGELDLGGTFTGSVTLGGVLTVDGSCAQSGDVTLASGTLDPSINDFDIKIGGNWVNNGGTFIPQSATATMYTSLEKLLSFEPGADDLFGFAVAVDGDYAVVGAYKDDTKVSDGGAAFVYKRDDNGTPGDTTDDIWQRHAVLTASDGASTDYFGNAVAIDGTTILIGAQYDDGRRGSAYVFVLDNDSWVQLPKLTTADRNSWDKFGFAVDIDGDYAVLSALRDDDGGSDSGSAYVFIRNDGGTPGNPIDDTWSQQDKIIASDDGVDDYFGWDVAIEGDTVLVGQCAGEGPPDNGAVYVFERVGVNWNQQTKITAPDGALDDFFGYSVALDNGTALIGARLDDDNGDGSGSAYIYTGAGAVWTFQAKLTPDDGAVGDQFGMSVSLDGGTAIIGASEDDVAGVSSGSAYIFSGAGAVWSQDYKFSPVSADDGDYFGRPVAIDNNNVLIGSYGADDFGGDSGVAYIINLTGNPDVTIGGSSATSFNDLVIRKSIVTTSLGNDIGTNNDLTLARSTLSTDPANDYQLTVGQDLVFDGGTLDANESLIQVAGDLTYNSGTFTYDTSTVELNGSAAQNVAGLTYYDMTVNKSANTATLSGNVDVISNLTIDNGTLDVSINDYDLNIGSAWTNNDGTFNPRAGNVTFDGASTPGAIAGVNDTSFYDLTINKTNQTDVVRLQNSSTASNILTFTSGTLDVQSGSLSIPASATLLVNPPSVIPMDWNNYPTVKDTVGNLTFTVSDSAFLDIDGVNVSDLA
ncbi:FG-GAP-like repeat-containing protein, partial [Planctomycetota bacterium]